MWLSRACGSSASQQSAPHHMLLQSCDVELWRRIMAALSAPTTQISFRTTLLRVFQVPLRTH